MFVKLRANCRFSETAVLPSYDLFFVRTYSHTPEGAVTFITLSGQKPVKGSIPVTGKTAPHLTIVV